MSDLVKKLTGKNQQDFEFAAAQIINNADFEAFSELVGQSDFLFDFIKKNVEKRLANAVNENNYKNLIKFLTIYSPDYEDFIVSSLVEFADEDLTDEMLEFLESGSTEQKTYAAKYFSQINDTLAVEALRKNSYSDNESLALNCAEALSKFGDKKSYDDAVEKLQSQDEFEKLSAVKFLIAYKDIKALDMIFDIMKKSSMPENIAAEIPYMKGILELLETENKQNAILVFNYILSGLGEIISLSQVFDFEVFEVLQYLVHVQKQGGNSQNAVVLLNAKIKFEQLTENDEYLFDEDKNIKAEIVDIKDFLNSLNPNFWQNQKNLIKEELIESSDFIFCTLELVFELNLHETFDKLKELINSSNQTLILKSIEVIKSLGLLDKIDKNLVLEKVSDDNISAILEAMFLG